MELQSDLSDCADLSDYNARATISTDKEGVPCVRLDWPKCLPGTFCVFYFSIEVEGVRTLYATKRNYEFLLLFVSVRIFLGNIRLIVQPMFPPKPFDNFPPDAEGGCSEGLDAFRFFLKQKKYFHQQPTNRSRRAYHK